MPFARELQVALDAARRAGAVVMSIYAGEFAVDYKGHDDPVTAADRAANELIVEALHRAFPDDAICAEEASADESLAAVRRGGRCWFVDPLDGTREFVARNGEFCVMIGLAVDGTARLGAVVAPAWNRVLWGIPGEGAHEVGVDGVDRALRVNPKLEDPSHARMVVSRSHPGPYVRIVADALGVSDVHPCGSVGLKAALVATGEADLYVHDGAGPKLWDGCAPDAIARAAGATVSDARGRPLRYDGRKLALDDGIVIGSAGVHALAIGALSRRPESRH